jgi:hypothetical protein
LHLRGQLLLGEFVVGAEVDLVGVGDGGGLGAVDVEAVELDGELAVVPPAVDDLAVLADVGALTVRLAVLALALVVAARRPGVLAEPLLAALVEVALVALSLQ